MIRELRYEDIKLGAWILRKDVVPSQWLEDKLYYPEQVTSLQRCFRKAPHLFQVVL
jgi:hypothetical protein